MLLSGALLHYILVHFWIALDTWIKKHQNSFSVTLSCKIFKLNRSSYYHWIKNDCVVNKIYTQLNKLIKDIFIQSRQTYGTRRLKEALIQRYGLIVSKRRIGKIMSFLNLKTK